MGEDLILVSFYWWFYPYYGQKGLIYTLYIHQDTGILFQGICFPCLILPRFSAGIVVKLNLIMAGEGGVWLRVIGGSARGRILRSPKGTKIRPTADRVKEALFNVLAGRIKDAVVLDLFAGTGALGIEALSRGAARAVFVDRSRDSISLIRHNLALTGLLPCAELYREDAGVALSLFQRQGRSFDLIFLDPPYGEGIALSVLGKLAQSGVLSPGGLVAVEHSPRDSLTEQIANLQLWRQRRYGDTVLTFYRREEETDTL